VANLRDKRALRGVCKEAREAVDMGVRRLTLRAASPAHPAAWPAGLALAARFGGLRALAIEGPCPAAEELLALAALHLPHLRALALDGQLDPPAVAALAAAPWWPRLRALRLPGLGAESTRVALAGLGASLQALDLSELPLVHEQLNSRGGAALQVAVRFVHVAVSLALAAAPLPHLRSLTLHGRWLGAPTLRRVLAAHGEHLTELRIHRNPLPDDGGMAALAALAAARLPSLERLDLASYLAGSAAAQLGAARCPRLRHLRLHVWSLSDEEAARLAAGLAPRLRSLELQLHSLGVPIPTAALLQEACPELESLSLAFDWARAPGAMAHVAALRAPRLRALALDAARRVSPAEMELLQGAEWPLLECLTLAHPGEAAQGGGGGGGGGDAADALRRRFPRLRRLVLPGAQQAA
jgi:hypothetical protein